LASRKRTDSSKQFDKSKRLAQVVVCTAVEPSDTIGNGVSRRKKEHWRLAPSLSKMPQYRQPVGLRQPTIEKHNVPRISFQASSTFVAIRSMRDKIAFFSQSSNKKVRYRRVILDNKEANAHLNKLCLVKQWLKGPRLRALWKLYLL
jgi:hypothetical protein